MTQSVPSEYEAATPVATGYDSSAPSSMTLLSDCLGVILGANSVSITIEHTFGPEVTIRRPTLSTWPTTLACLPFHLNRSRAAHVLVAETT